MSIAKLIFVIAMTSSLVSLQSCGSRSHNKDKPTVASPEQTGTQTGLNDPVVTSPSPDPQPNPGSEPVATEPVVDPGAAPPEPTPVLTPDPVLTPEPTPVTPTEPLPVPAPQIARFTVWLDLVEENLLGLTPEVAAVRLEGSKSREFIFNLQALGRLYEDEDPEFKSMRKTFKALEDAIGEYQKWKDLTNDGVNAGVSPLVLARLQKRRDDNFEALKASLVTTRFVPVDGVTLPYTTTLRNFLSTYSWKEVGSDRNMVLRKIIAELKEIETTKYDFTHLEEGDGVHEFRRKMRWIAMEARGLNGVITLKPKTTPCPVADYAAILNDSIATTKYAVLTGSPSEPNPITLSPCLYVRLAKLIDEVNWVKARAELDDNLSEEEPTDAVDPKDQILLEKLLQDSLTNNLFGLLQNELALGIGLDGQAAPIKDYSLSAAQLNFFAVNKVHEIEITAASWQDLAEQDPKGGLCSTEFVGKPFTWFHFEEFKIDGVSFLNIGAKKRSSCESFSKTKPSLNIELSKYEPANEDLAKDAIGLDKLTLNNTINDPTYIRQCLAYRFMEKAGIPVPLCNFARVVVNGVSLGLYVSVQPQEKAYLKSRFGKNLGNVYEVAFENFQESDLDRYKNDMESYKEDKDESLSDLKAVMAVLNAEVLDLARLGQVVDLPYIINYWAVEKVLDHRQGFVAANNNSYMYFPPNGKMRLLPRGTDQVLAHNPGQETREFTAKNLLAQRLAEVPEVVAKVEARMHQLLYLYWNEAELNQDVTSADEIVRPFLQGSELIQYPAALQSLQYDISTRKMDLSYKEPFPLPALPAAISYPVVDAAWDAVHTSRE